MTWQKSTIGNVIFNDNKIMMKPNEVYFRDNNSTGFNDGEIVGGGYYINNSGDPFVVATYEECNTSNATKNAYLADLETTTGFPGWYIPDITKLMVMYNNKGILNMTHHGYISSTPGTPSSVVQCICFNYTPSFPGPPPTIGQIVNGPGTDYCYRAIRDI